MKGDQAAVYTCVGGCRCTLDAEDPTKRGCGRAVEQANLMGTGLYFCNCGGSRGCNTVSAVPGRCRCGMELKQAMRSAVCP